MNNSFIRSCFKIHIYAAILVSQLSLFSGFTHAYSAILIPQLSASDSSIYVDISAASWIASFGTICRPLGALFEGLIIDKFGRKVCVEVAMVLHAISWMVLGFAPNLNAIYASRIVTSFATGMETAAGIYITEISPTSQRGTLLSLMAPITASGSLITYIFGYFLSWRYTALLFGIYGWIIVVLLLCMHESPIWFMIKNKKHQALESLMWLRNDNKSQVKNELEELEMKIETYKDDKMKFYFKRFTSRSVWKPFIILIIFSILQKSAGQDAIFAYAVDFFSVFKTDLNQNVLSIIFAVMSLAGSLNIMLIVHKFDRTTILLGSGLTMSLSLAISGICLSMNLKTAAVVCIFLYIYFCMSGMMSVPYMIIGESFPNHVRGVMGAVVTMFIFFPSFLNIKMYPSLLQCLQPIGLLYCYAFFALCAAIFSKLFIFETRGKTLDEIKEYYEKNLDL